VWRQIEKDNTALCVNAQVVFLNVHRKVVQEGGAQHLCDLIHKGALVWGQLVGEIGAYVIAVMKVVLYKGY
jgi:hypothetical protein